MHTSFVSYVASASQGMEISNTLACSLANCGLPPSVLNATVDQTAEVTLGDVVTHTCDERTTDSGVFDGSRFLNQLFEQWSLHQRFNMFRTNFFFRCGCEEMRPLA